MMKNLIVTLCLLAAGVFAACDNEDNSPYILIKDENAVEIAVDTVYVDLNSVKQLLVEVGYNGSDPSYLRQVDGGEIVKLNETEDLDVISNAYSSFHVQKAIVTTNFSEDIMSNGSVVVITVRISTDYSKSVNYKVL